jgi:hypothetical protein
MLNTMPLLNVNKTAKLGSYASFPGSGPVGSFCSGCALQVPDKSRFVCGKYQSLTGRKGSPISPGSPSCRYFLSRPPFNPTGK